MNTHSSDWRYDIETYFGNTDEIFLESLMLFWMRAVSSCLLVIT